MTHFSTLKQRTYISEEIIRSRQRILNTYNISGEAAAFFHRINITRRCGIAKREFMAGYYVEKANGYSVLVDNK